MWLAKYRCIEIRTTMALRISILLKKKGLQAHHLIPEDVWGSFEIFFDNIGMGGQMDLAANGILIPSNARSLAASSLDIIHSSQHPNFSDGVFDAVGLIATDFYSGDITTAQAQNRIADLQRSLEYDIRMGDVPTTPSPSQPGCESLS